MLGGKNEIPGGSVVRTSIDLKDMKCTIHDL